MRHVRPGTASDMSDDPQEVAEALDEDVVDVVDDRTGDEFGEGLPDYPPDRPLGVNTVGVTPVEEDAGESFAERTWREQPEEEDVAGDHDRGVGQLVDNNATSEDHEAELTGESQPGPELGPEERAMHAEED
jgi:hypothetical protein